MSVQGAVGTIASSDGWRLVRNIVFVLVVMAVPTWAARPSSKNLGIAAEVEELPVSRPRPTAASAPASQAASQPTSQPASQPASQPTTQSRNADISPAAIDAAKTRVQAANDLSDADKKQILAIYDQAIGLIKVADDWQVQITKIQEDMDQIPTKLDAANAKLAQPVEDLTPHVPSNTVLAQVEKLYSTADELDRTARQDLRSLVREQQACQDRNQEITNRQTVIREQTTHISEELSGLANAATELEQAQRTRLRTQSRAMRRESRALEAQHLYDVARQPLLTVQIDLANRYQKATENALKAWKQTLEEYRAAELEHSAAQARQQRLARQQDRPEIRELAQQIEQLTQQRLDFRKTIDNIQRDIPSREKLSEDRRDVLDKYRTTSDRIETAGLTQAISSELQRRGAQLPDVHQHQRHHRHLEAEISKAQLDLIDLEDARAPLTDIDKQANQILDAIGTALSSPDRDAINKQLHDLLRAKRKCLDDLMQDYDTASRNWIEIQSQEQQLIDATRKYAALIEANVLWIRSSHPIQLSMVQHTWEAVSWLISPTGWMEIASGLWADLQANPLTLPMGIVAVCTLVAVRRRLRLRLRIVDDLASKGKTYTFFHTLEAMIITVLLALPGPCLLWLLGWRLSAAVTTSDFPTAIAAGLRSAAVVFFVLELVRQICRSRGLGQTHLHWPDESMQLLRHNLAWSMPIAVPLIFVIFTIERQSAVEYKDSLGRLAFIAGVIILAFLARCLLHPQQPLIASYLQHHRDGWLERFRFLWYPVAVAIPAAMVLAAAMGYTYTSMQITGCLLATAALVFGVLIVKALLLRLLFVARRRLAIEAARKRMSPVAAMAIQPIAIVDGRVTATTDVAIGKSAAAAAEPEVDLAAIDAQTRRLVRIAVLVAMALGFWGIWADILPALGILDRVRLWQTMLDNGDKYNITLGVACMASLVMLMAVAAARNIPGLLEITFLQLMPLEAGARYAINAISRYVIIVTGLMIACSKLGIGWSKVQWLAAAMTVGLGFGLQEIFANFISGLIILFERPIRVGDIVTVRDISGTVSKIRIRATTIVNWDRKELIVPNKEFITGQVMNWTLSDPILRMTISVGVTHGADADEVQKILLRTAKENCHILENPKPTAFFIGFQDNALRFQLRVFVPRPEVCMSVQDELGRAINTALREKGIEGSFVQGLI